MQLLCLLCPLVGRATNMNRHDDEESAFQTGSTSVQANKQQPDLSSLSPLWAVCLSSCSFGARDGNRNDPVTAGPKATHTKGSLRSTRTTRDTHPISILRRAPGLRQRALNGPPPLRTFDIFLPSRPLTFVSRALQSTGALFFTLEAEDHPIVDPSTHARHACVWADGPPPFPLGPSRSGS